MRPARFVSMQTNVWTTQSARKAARTLLAVTAAVARKAMCSITTTINALTTTNVRTIPVVTRIASTRRAVSGAVVQMDISSITR